MMSHLYLKNSEHGPKCFDFGWHFENQLCKICLTWEQFLKDKSHIRCRSELLPLGFSKFALVLIL